MGSVTRWLDFLFNIWPFAQMKIYKAATKMAKIGLQILSKTKITEDSKYFAKVGKILPNLVTLLPA